MTVGFYCCFCLGERIVEVGYPEKPNPSLHSPQQATSQKREVYQPYNRQHNTYHQSRKQQEQSRWNRNRDGYRQRDGRRQHNHAVHQQPYRQHGSRGNQRHYWPKQEEDDDGDLFVGGLGDGRSIELDGDSLRISVTFSKPEVQVQNGASSNGHPQRDMQVVPEGENEVQLPGSVHTSRQVGESSNNNPERDLQQVVLEGEDEVQLSGSVDASRQVGMGQPVSDTGNGIREPVSAVDRHTGSFTFRSTTSNLSNDTAVNSLPFSSLKISVSSSAAPVPNTTLQQAQPVLSSTAAPQYQPAFGLLPHPAVGVSPVSFPSPRIPSKPMERPSLAQMKILVGSSTAPFQTSAPGIRPLNRPPTQFGLFNQGAAPRMMMPPGPRPVLNRLSPSPPLPLSIGRSAFPVRPSAPVIVNIKQYQLAELCAKDKLELEYVVRQVSSGKWMAIVRCGNDEVTQTGCNSDVEAKEKAAEVALMQLQTKVVKTQGTTSSTQQATVAESCLSDVDYKWLLKVQCEEHHKVTPRYSVKRVGGRYAGVVQIGTKYTFTTPKPYPTRKQAETEAAKLALNSMDSKG